MMFALVQMGEYIHAFAISAIFTTLFLNGWAGPIPIAPYLWFIFKTFGVFLILIWFRGTLPRFRIDQLMAFNWKFLVPLSVANVIMVAVVHKLLGAAGLSSTQNTWVWALAMFAANLVLMLIALTLAGRAGRHARQRAAARAEGRAALPATGR
jgi:NADH:ubiquinone oxidoreductase subunit H